MKRTRLILSLLLAVVLVPAVLQSDTGPFSPYLEIQPEGRVDWDNGVIYGVGKGYLHLNGGSKDKALTAARNLALQSVLKLASGVRLDDQNTIQTVGSGQVVVELQGLIRYQEHDMKFVKDAKQPYFEVTRRASLKGVEGLTSRLLSRLKSGPFQWKDFPGPSQAPLPDEDSAPWLVLDARKLPSQERANPALFPKILDAGGNVLYDLNRTDQDALAQKGMARYVVSDTPADKLSSIQDREKLLDMIADLLAAQEAYAQDEDEESPKRRKRRQFIVNEVEKADGLMKTNLVISQGDAKELKAEDASSQILKKCRVIVVVNSPLGGIEGSLPHWLSMTLE